MGRTLEVKMAKASPDDLRIVWEFFEMIEEVIEYGTFTKDDSSEEMVVDSEKFVSMIRERWGKNSPGVATAWCRVVWGCEILISNCCDPGADTLEWRPDIVKAMEGE